jgi:hypothetical protein
LDGPFAQRRLRRAWQGSSIFVRHAPSLRQSHPICLPQ